MEIPERKGNQTAEIHEQLVHPEIESRRLTNTMRLDIIAETEDFVAVSKPSGLLTLPDRFDNLQESLRGMLMQTYGEIFTVHRLDRDTSGLILFAKHPEAQKHFSAQFEERAVDKYYMGIAVGRMTQSEGTFDQPLTEHPTIKGKMTVARKGKHAITHFQTLETIGKFTLLALRIETGRTHQIRVHLQNAGHPIACDPIYGSGEPILLSSVKRNFKLSKEELNERPLLNRLALHAWKLGITGLAGEKIELEAPLHKDMEACIRQLRKWGK
jgi:23S rRNA pseudouridine955/2504/2580 synthase/23S rRNA pseudouridine1911/1915/1917 synthase